MVKAAFNIIVKQNRKIECGLELKKVLELFSSGKEKELEHLLTKNVPIDLLAKDTISITLYAALCMKRLKADEDPDRLSCVHCVRVIRRKLIGFAGIPYRDRKTFHESVLNGILEERAVSRRGRFNPRAVKRKMSNWQVKSRSRNIFGLKLMKLKIIVFK